jgi:S1-C subfamily serine protease
VKQLVLMVAALLVTALVAAGVTLAVLQYQSLTNPQQLNLRSGITITEDSAVVQAAARARPAVVSVVTQQKPTVSRGSGYLVTSDGYIVTNIEVIAGAGAMTVLVPGDERARDARLVDYDCQTGVAVLKIDKVRSLPTLAFADPNALVQGQVILAVGGPFEGGAATPGHVIAMHRVVSIPNPSLPSRKLELSDTIQTSAFIDSGTAGGPLLNVGGQVIGIAMKSQLSMGGNGYGLNVADIQDDVQQILQTGQVTVSSLGVTGTELTPEVALLNELPVGSQILTVSIGGPAGLAGLQPGDVITQLDDVKIDAAHPLGLLLRSRFHPNQRVTVSYWRAGASTQTQLTLSSQRPTCS